MSDSGDVEAPASPEVQVEIDEQPEAPESSTPEQVEPQPQETPETTEQPEAETKPEAEAAEPEASPPEEQPAEAAEPEAERPEEGEKAAEDKPAEDGKTEEEAKPEPEEEEKPVEEEPVVITPEGNPHWLSTEDVLAKDLPESEVENFRNFYFKHAHSLQAHYDAVKDFCVETEYITLSKEEIDALTAEGELSEEQQQCLNGLRDRINAVMELWEGDGALIRINDRSAKDAYLDRTDEAFVETIRDSVINSLEFEKQSICAYSVWKDQEHHPGVFKRGMTKLRASFRRSRTNSAGRRRPKLEEEKKDEKKEDGKEEEKKPEGEAKDETPAAAEGEGAAATEVTVEAEVENAEDKPEEATPKEEEAPKEEPAAAEPPKEEEPKDEAPKEVEPEVAEAPKPEEDKKEEEKKEDGEIQAAPAEEGEAKKEEDKAEAKDGEEVKSKPAKSPKKKKSEESHHHHHHHQHKAAKNEPLDNRVLRAFGRVMGAQYEVKDGQAALDQLRSSARIRRDLNKLKAFGGVEGVQVSMSICRWKSHISDHTGMIFRGFVYENELRALSQYNDTTYYPNVVHYKDQVISGKIQNFFAESVKEALKDLNNYIVDFFVAPDKIYVLRLNPFYTAVGACLFTWNDGRVLTKGPFEFRVVDAPKMAPEAYSSYQQCWTDMLNSVLQQRKAAARPARSGATCIIL